MNWAKGPPIPELQVPARARKDYYPQNYTPAHRHALLLQLFHPNPGQRTQFVRNTRTPFSLSLHFYLQIHDCPVYFRLNSSYLAGIYLPQVTSDGPRVRVDISTGTWRQLALTDVAGHLGPAAQDSEAVLSVYLQWYRESVLRKEVNAMIVYGKIILDITRRSYQLASTLGKERIVSQGLAIRQQLEAVGYHFTPDLPPSFHTGTRTLAPARNKPGPLALIARARADAARLKQ